MQDIPRGGVGGNSIAQILQDHCPDLALYAGMVIDQLDSQVGTWQFSTDGGHIWRTVRTDLINRAGSLGLALDRNACLRVLPFGGSRVSSARVAFHAAQPRPGQWQLPRLCHRRSRRRLFHRDPGAWPWRHQRPAACGARAPSTRAAQAVSAASTGHALAIA